jgi:DNA-binding transcriptional LysR family regulator
MASADELDWDDLRYFLRAVEAKTLAGAARTLGVEHSTIGRRLTALERSFGAALVLRGPDGLTLTPLGERLLPLIRDVERSVRAVEHGVASHTVRVRLAVPSGLSKLFTASLSRLREEQPAVALELVSGARLVDLKQGEADLALRSGPVDDVDLVTLKLCDLGWSLYAAHTYLAPRLAVDLSDLSAHDWIGYDESLAALPASRWLEERASTSRRVLRSREMTDMLAAAVNGAGLAVLPCALGDEEPLLCRLTPQVVCTRAVSLVYCREAKLSAAVRAVIQYVVALVRAADGRISGVVQQG